MKKSFLILIQVLLLASGFAQETAIRYGTMELAADLDYIAAKVKVVHNAPFTGHSEADFDAKTQLIRSMLCDSMTRQEFGQAVAPLFQMLCDEHAFVNNTRITAPAPKRTSGSKAVRYDRFGNVGIVTIDHFLVNKRYSIDVWRKEIGQMAQVIRRDGIRTLLIDVSRNGGGNSQVGELLLSYFCPTDYRSYALTWRRSDEYLEFLNNMNIGSNADVYRALKPGEYLTRPSVVVPARKELKPFRGKLWVAVGPGTFSSAMIFATVVHDNRLATLIGEVPQHAHPNHFGEMIFLTTPNTEMRFGFGVKHFVRPSGDADDNSFVPDVPADLSQIENPADWLPYLK